MSTLNYEAALDVASEGKFLKDVCAALGCKNLSQLRAIRDNNPEFAVRFQRAREDGFMLLSETLLTIVEDNPTLHPFLIKLKAENLKWLLSKLHHQVFGDRLDVNVTERVNIIGAITESRARCRVINPPELSINPLD
jgi:hypothetical protein